MSTSINWSARILGFLSLAIVLAGCGGGGSPSPSGNLSYFADFTSGTGSGPTGQSEQVQLKRANGTVVATQFVNTGTGIQQLTFSHLPNTTLTVVATLYQGLGGTAGLSTAVGTATAQINGGVASVVQTSLQQPVVSVSVLPTPTTVNVGAAETLIAEPLDVNGKIVFQSAAPTWASGAPQFVSVNSQGVATGVAAGEANIQATFGVVSGTADVTALATGVTKGEWTIMVFLNSANDLDFESVANMQQMENVATGSQVRFIVQWKLSASQNSGLANHPFNSTRRYLVVPHGLQLIQEMGTNVNMGSFQTLNDFVTWAQKNYPANHYLLDLWDHGNGWRSALQTKKPPYRGISYDYDFPVGNSYSHIDVWQLGAALGANHVDVLSFDACLMQMLEIQDEVVGRADYMLCAEDNTPGPGYPYDTAFQTFFANPTASTPTLLKDVCDAFIARYINDPDYKNGPLSQSAVDVSKIPSVVTALDNFSVSLINAGPSIGPTVSNVRSGLLAYDAADGYYFYDLKSLADRFAASSTAGVNVTSAASALSAAAQNAVVYSRANSNSPNSTGLSIEFGNSTKYNTYGQFYPGGVNPYPNLQLAQHTHWPAVLGSTTLNPAP